MATNVISTTKLCKTFSVGGRQQHVLRNLDLEIRRGDFTVVMGASGAGKSTLLYALSGIDSPTLGEIEFCGQRISRMSSDRLAVFRRRNCGFVFQQICLLDNMSLMDNVLAAGLLLDRDRRRLAAKAAELFAQVGLNEQDWRKFPAQLSGGEAQRGAIVRALINDPVVLFADEPTGTLNSAAGTAVLDLFTQINASGQSVVLVTHDIRSACRGNRVLYLQDGGLQGELDLGVYTGEGAKREVAAAAAGFARPATADLADSAHSDTASLVDTTHPAAAAAGTTLPAADSTRPAAAHPAAAAGTTLPAADSTRPAAADTTARTEKLHAFLAGMGW